MAEYKDYIYIHTSHTMYPANDKLNHQANVNFCYDQTKDKITDSYTGISNINNNGYVSHSFNQFVQVDSSANILTVDLGDGYPRAIALARFATKAGSKKYIGKTSSVNIRSFAGNKGDNFTGASIGGFEFSKNKYLVAYSYKTSAGAAKNVYLATVSRNKFSSGGVSEAKITNYSSAKETSASTPVLVKIDHSNFALMWEAVSAYNYKKQVYYVMLNEKGKVVGGIKKVSGSLSDCQPIVDGNKLIWYTTDRAFPVFYSLNYKTGKVSVSNLNGDIGSDDASTSSSSSSSKKNSSSTSSSSSSSTKNRKTSSSSSDDEDDEDEDEDDDDSDVVYIDGDSSDDEDE